MLKNFFLTFSNRLITDDPANLRTILNEIAKELPESDQPKPGWDDFISDTIFYLLDKGPEVIPEFKKTINEAYSRNTTAVGPLESIFETVFGHMDGFCEKQCPRRYGRELLLGEVVFNGNTLTCIECEQLYFVAALERFIKQKKIYSYQSYHDTLDDCFNIESELGELEPDFPYGIPGKFDNWDQKFFLQDYLARIAGYSLKLFLKEKARQNLKRCPYCRDFFEKKNTRKVHCYKNPSCEKQYQRIKKQKQREREPEIYNT